LMLDPTRARRLFKICGMFGSAYAGERAEAARLADALVRDAGETWETVILRALSPPPTGNGATPTGLWRDMVHFCLRHQNFDVLNKREVTFLRSMSRWRGAPSHRQRQWLENIFERLEDAA
jgi:hypothetical protein